MPKIDEVKEFIGFMMIPMILSLVIGLGLLIFIIYRINTFKYE